METLKLKPMLKGLFNGNNSKVLMPAHLLEHFPVIVVMAHHHDLQLLRLEEVHHVYVAHREEPPLKLLEHSLHRLVEGVLDERCYKLFPIKEPELKCSQNMCSFACTSRRDGGYITPV